MKTISADRLGFEWWSDSTGSVQVDGTDVLNITIEWRDFDAPGDDKEYDPNLSEEQKEEIYQWAIDTLAKVITGGEN